MERLQRVLSAYGVASRRKAEEMILEGRVTVDGRVVTELGTKVDPSRQEIRVDGELLRPERPRYIILNKPSGYITTMSDERGRRTVMDLVDVPERVVPVGRLDRDTAGLLLLTNDGDVIHRVTHPRYELDKEYEALVDGHPPPEVLERLRRGVTLEDGRIVPDLVRPLRNEEAGTVLRIVVHEGRNRIVRRMLERVGYPVLKLTRTRVGPLSVRGLPVGAWRDLTAGELAQLREALDLEEAVPPTRPAPRAPRERPRERGYGAPRPTERRERFRPGRREEEPAERERPRREREAPRGRPFQG
ncbi:MAG: rRNA pseudouridine synthase, partial [Thermomicrobiaceae bacterium]|nr:rRNA pseudouridine synthase [Thermomicrobiaceae bacterium]